MSQMKNKQKKHTKKGLGFFHFQFTAPPQMDTHQNVKIKKKRLFPINVLTSTHWGVAPKQMPYLQPINRSVSSSLELIELKVETDLQARP